MLTDDGDGYYGDGDGSHCGYDCGYVDAGGFDSSFDDSADCGCGCGLEIDCVSRTYVDCASALQAPRVTLQHQQQHHLTLHRSVVLASARH